MVIVAMCMELGLVKTLAAMHILPGDTDWASAVEGSEGDADAAAAARAARGMQQQARASSSAAGSS
eukprot:3084659-Lingulodinium_polyedra.AAC.1